MLLVCTETRIVACSALQNVYLSLFSRYDVVRAGHDHGCPIAFQQPLEGERYVQVDLALIKAERFIHCPRIKSAVTGIEADLDP